MDIQTTTRRYLLDVSDVDTEETEEALEVLRRMHGHGGFELHVTM